MIADGIVAMEGNGPLNGTARPLGKIVLADDPVAADATCAYLMGFKPDTLRTFVRAQDFWATVVLHSSTRLETPSMRRRSPFQVVREFRHLYAL